MILLLNDIGEEGLDVEGALAPEVLESREQDPVRCVTPIHCQLHCQIVDETLLVDGCLSAGVALRCRRCDCLFEGAVENRAYHFDQELVPMPESVDLTEDIREAMILAFPSYPLCREGCKGLCAQCGTNLNETKCTCQPPADGRWGALESLGKE